MSQFSAASMALREMNRASCEDAPSKPADRKVSGLFLFFHSSVDQHQKMETFTAPFTVLRLLTPLKMSYEAAKRRAEPYTKIVGELPDTRKETVLLIKDVIGHNRRAYVLVNNRLEGNSPLTIQALTDVLTTE